MSHLSVSELVLALVNAAVCPCVLRSLTGTSGFDLVGGRSRAVPIAGFDGVAIGALRSTGLRAVVGGGRRAGVATRAADLAEAGSLDISPLCEGGC